MTRYRAPARALHWITAVLVLATIAAGLLMVRDDAPFGDALFLFHKNVGVVILILVALRLAWRAISPPPPLTVPLAGVAKATHWALYATLIVLGVSGYVRVTAGGFPLEIVDLLGLPRMEGDPQVADTAKRVHWAAHYVIIGLTLLHMAAAARHGLRRDGVMGRML
ncbi:cytochrome b [Falsirhodobacter halotolerans]|uniref:cytochrome b n=1 Tax=Falsirhodobacter halotolerans TaxID=1146892 RepID=UPI001FD2EB65|nr:cytochrome b [Falsirhodobacter halotolerans]MCJ8138920.1 cytochrome b [Falsirhodobacter halotolerans]